MANEKKPTKQYPDCVNAFADEAELEYGRALDGRSFRIAVRQVINQAYNAGYHQAQEDAKPKSAPTVREDSKGKGKEKAEPKAAEPAPLVQADNPEITATTKK